MPVKKRITKATVPAQEGSAERAGRGVSVRDRVLKYIEKASGTIVYVNDMSTEMDLTQGQIAGAVRGLLDSGRLPQLEVVLPGRSWRWNANAKANVSGKRMFEEMTTTKAGVVLVQDENGNVYKLEEL